MSFACFYFLVFSPSALIFVIIRFEAAQMGLVWWNRLFSSGWKQDQDTLQRIRLPDLPARTFLWENSQRVGCKDHFYTAHSPDTRLVLELFFWKHRLDYVTTFSCQASGNLHLPNSRYIVAWVMSGVFYSKAWTHFTLNGFFCCLLGGIGTRVAASTSWSSHRTLFNHLLITYKLILQQKLWHESAQLAWCYL